MLERLASACEIARLFGGVTDAEQGTCIYHQRRLARDDRHANGDDGDQTTVHLCAFPDRPIFRLTAGFASEGTAPATMHIHPFTKN